MKRMIVTLITAAWMSQVAMAAGISAAQFLKLGAGARATAMGDAFVSVANDVTATYWNPAGLKQLQTSQIGAMQNTHFVDTQYQYLGAALPRANDAFGISFYRLDYGTIDRYSNSDVKDGSFSAGSMAASLSYARALGENLKVGASAKYISESIESEKASTFAMDLGVLHRMGRYNLGGTVQNFGPAMKMVQESASLPLTIRVGASTKFIEDCLLVSVDASKANDNSGSLHAGTEYGITKIVTVRGGYNLTLGDKADLGGLLGLTGGLGVTFNRFTLDYSVTPFGDLGISHRFSLRVSLGQSN